MGIYVLTERIDDMVADAVLSPAVAPAQVARPDHGVRSSREGNAASAGAPSNHARMPPSMNFSGRGAAIPKRGRGGYPARG